MNTGHLLTFPAAVAASTLSVVVASEVLQLLFDVAHLLPVQFPGRCERALTETFSSRFAESASQNCLNEKRS